MYTPTMKEPDKPMVIPAADQLKAATGHNPPTFRCGPWRKRKQRREKDKGRRFRTEGWAQAS